MNVWGDECLKIGRGWWMSEVMNVGVMNVGQSSSSIFIKEDLTRSLWGRSRVRKSPFFNAVASLHTDTAVLDSIRNLCDVSIYNHCDSLKSVCYSNYFLSLWNKFPFFGPICEQTVGIKSSGSNMAESSPNSTSECLTACSINSQNVKNIFISHSWFQMVDHSDGHFFKTMEWSMVFEKKPL